MIVGFVEPWHQGLNHSDQQGRISCASQLKKGVCESLEPIDLLVGELDVRLWRLHETPEARQQMPGRSGQV